MKLNLKLGDGFFNLNLQAITENSQISDKSWLSYSRNFIGKPTDYRYNKPWNFKATIPANSFI